MLLPSSMANEIETANAEKRLTSFITLPPLKVSLLYDIDEKD
jgi:hypothetical protein